MNKKKLFFGIVVLIIIVVLFIFIFNKQKPGTAQDSVPIITKAPPGAQLIDVPKDFFDNNSESNLENNNNDLLNNQPLQ